MKHLQIAFAQLAGAMPTNNSRERGGIVLSLEDRLEFQELPNRSPSDRRYTAVAPALEHLPGRLIGFWHTHPGSALPSLTDLRELIRINQRFGQSFALCIVGRRACSITVLGRLRIPRLRLWSRGSLEQPGRRV